jgi:putative inorganic carbon (HCO3(-)) transporter
MMAFLLLVAYLAAIFIRPHEIGDPYSTSKIIRTLIILTFASYMLLQKDKFFAPQLKAVVGLAFVIALSSIFNGWAGGAIHLIIAFLPAALFPMMVCAGLITTQKRQVVVMVVCIVAAMFMVHNGHSQHLHPDGLGWTGTRSVEGDRITYMGFFNDPNDLGMFLVMTLPFLFYFKSFGGKLTKIAALAGAGAVIYGVIMTNSRGSLLGLLTLFSLYFYLKYGLKKSILTAVVALPIVMVVMSTFRKIEQGESAQGRVDAWYQGFHMFFSNPLLGVGKGNFTEYNSHTAHNSFVLVLGELGLAGYVLWFMVLGISVYSLYRVVNWYEKLPHKYLLSEKVIKEVALNRALLFSFFGFITTCFFLSRSYSLLFFVFCGFAIASFNRASILIPQIAIENYSPLIKRLFKQAMISIVVLFVIVKVLI